ncbi:MAG TPA: hypothetical protein PLG47_04605 [Candidatus Dojkabacteria bacterium]|nr:hypothetical protein [Candidatus Dojkabacteria bacterium]
MAKVKGADKAVKEVSKESEVSKEEKRAAKLAALKERNKKPGVFKAESLGEFDGVKYQIIIINGKGTLVIAKTEEGGLTSQFLTGVSKKSKKGVANLVAKMPGGKRRAQEEDEDEDIADETSEDQD